MGICKSFKLLKQVPLRGELYQESRDHEGMILDVEVNDMCASG